MTDAPAPWERQPAESRQAFEAFAVYRDLGSERSVRKVVQTLNKSLTVIGGWSSKHRWVDRVAAFDAEQDRRALEELTRKQLRARSTHSRLAGAVMAQVAQGLQSNPTGKELRDLAATLESAARVEARALGIGEALHVSGPDGGPMQLQAGPLPVAEMEERLRSLQAEIARELAAGESSNVYPLQ